MESLSLKKVSRKLHRQELKEKRKTIIKNSPKFNFGEDSKGNILTSTYNAKAHTYNRLQRESDKQREENFNKMLIAYNNGEVSEKKPLKLSKGAKRNAYKKSIQKAEDTRAFLKMICELISEGAKEVGETSKGIVKECIVLV